jgi:hypothetical protein
MSLPKCSAKPKPREKTQNTKKTVPPTQHSAPSTQHFLSTLSWAAYLGCSWTWCIGMFLPVLFVRDYGLAGWIVFAIPNCVGAAAMGWVLARPGASERIVAEHRTACVAFSAVTLAFHAFFLSWLAWRIIPVEGCIAAVVMGSALAFIFRSRHKLDLVLAWIVLGISLVVLVRGLSHFTISERHGFQDGTDLIWLAPICVFGFALCPYLDLTFHRAKQATHAGDGKLAFALGFGVFFLAMIFLTLLYEGDFVAGHFGSFGAAGLKTWVALHIAAQTGFTWSAHLRALPPQKKKDLPIWIAAGILAAVAGRIIWVRSLEWFNQTHSTMLTGEAIYRIFMGFYGLVFPAYVWVCMVPLAGRSLGPARRPLLAWGLGVLIAAPMFWLGFIQGRMGWLGPGLTVVLLSRLAAGSGKPRQNPAMARVS